MLIDFNTMESATVPGMNGGLGEMTARMILSGDLRLVSCRMHPGCSIGTHRHESSIDINYVVAGEGEAICDGISEELRPGRMHICPRGSEHSIRNTGNEDLHIITIVVND